ncbi:MAG: pyrroloquinoline quinone biosynthesis protein PqqE, partial [Gammaproteobacteria bacterium]
ADPVCDKSPHHQALLNDVERIGKIAAKEDKTDLKEQPLIFRNMKNSKKILKGEELTPQVT